MTNWNTLGFHAAKEQYLDQEVIEVDEFMGMTTDDTDVADRQVKVLHKVRMPDNIYLGYEGPAWVWANKETGRAGFVSIPVGDPDFKADSTRLTRRQLKSEAGEGFR